MNRQERLQHGQELSEDFLAHYGVLGMKWGKRRAARQVSKSTMKKARASDKARITKLGEKVKKSNQADTDAMRALGLISKSTAKSISRAQGRATNSAVKRNLKLSKKVRKFERKSDAAKAANDINSKNQKTGNKNIKKVIEAEKRLLSAKTPEARNKIAKEINSLIKDNNSTISSRSKGLSRKQKKYIDRKNTLKENTGIKHGADMAGDFLAHYGGVKSKGGVSHDNNDTLVHYGVLGMKWGKRKGSSGSSIKSSKKSKKNPKASTLSDAELRQRINRLQMEKQYKQLTTKDRSTASKFVGDVVRESAKQTASSYVTKYMKSGVEAGINRAKKKKKKTS